MILNDANTICVAEVIECNNQTITVKGLPFWFTYTPILKIAGSDITIIDYIGNSKLGLLYVDKPVKFMAGTHINIQKIDKLDF